MSDMQPLTNKGRNDMSNWFDFRCPACGDEDYIDIEAMTWIRATVDGTDPDLSHDGGHDFTPDSAAQCHECGRFGTLRDFTPEDLA